jgi:hypothetical protein
MPFIDIHEEAEAHFREGDSESNNLSSIDYRTSDLPDTIYRYVEFKWFESNVADRVTLFARPELWPDSVENPVLASRGFVFNGNQIGLSKDLSKVAFGQCWTSDQQIREWCWWRYVNAKDVIRIGVRCSDYLNLITERFGDLSDVSVFWGHVCYWRNENAMREYIRYTLKRSLLSMDTSFGMLASTLFHKREFHLDEREFRMVIADHNLSALMSERFFTVRMNSVPLVSVDIGPNCNLETADLIETYFSNQFGIVPQRHNDPMIRENYWDIDV